MAVNATSALTLLDWAKRLDPNNEIAVIIELLSQTNEVLTDMLWLEGNLPTGHRTTVRTGLPAVTWRLLNYGVVPSKSTTAQVTDSCGMLEAYSEVDVSLAKLQNNLAQFRLSEAKSFIEAMNQEMARTIFKGNTTLNPERFMGLEARYNLLSAENGENIISAAGAGSDNTSIWLITWGDTTAHGIYPKGSAAGLHHDDLGEDTVFDAQTPVAGRFQAYRDHFKWDCGLTVRDWRYVVRIANIDVSNLVGISSAPEIINFMIRAMDKIPNAGMGRQAFYMNRTVHTMLKILALNKSNSALAIVPAANQFEMQFFGVPIRKVDALTNDEAVVA